MFQINKLLLHIVIQIHKIIHHDQRAGGRDGGQGWLLFQECKAGLTFENNSMSFTRLIN